jgi:photosystem II stability/assembly factor-like uncharacterized protein
MGARHWTPEEDAALLRGVDAGMTYERIAEAMPGRTADACRHRASEHLGVAKRRRTRVTPEQAAAIVDARARGWSWERIAAAVGMEAETLRWRWMHV